MKMSSDLLVQLAAFVGVVLMGILTYVFSYKATKSSEDDDKFLQVESKETKKEKIERAKKAEAKDKKKSKVKTTVAAPAEVVVQESPVANKSKKAEPKQETPKASKAKKSAKSVVVEAPVVVEETAPEEDGWTKVTDKKQKNKPVETTAKKAAKSDKTKNETKAAPVTVAPVVAAEEDNSWTTVTDKKQKKSSSKPEQQQTVVAEPVTASPETKSKKSKAKKAAAVAEEPVKAPEPVPVVESAPAKSKKSKAKTPEPAAPAAPVVQAKKVETPAVVEDEGEWITANSKVIKKSKDKAKAQKEESVKETAPATTAVAESPKASNKKNKKTREEVTSAPVAAPVIATKAAEPTPVKTIHEIPQAIQELMKTAGSNPVAAAIIEQFKNDSNNNLIQAKPAAPEPVVASETKTKSNNKKSADKVVEQVLKSTNLTESMILIDKAESKTGSSRTNSQPSSSESLQDLDVGEGWATITSKKKRTVRREA